MQSYLTQRIMKLIPGMEKSSAKPTPVFKTPIEKMSDLNREKWL